MTTMMTSEQPRQPSGPLLLDICPLAAPALPCAPGSPLRTKTHPDSEGDPHLLLAQPSPPPSTASKRERALYPQWGWGAVWLRPASSAGHWGCWVEAGLGKHDGLDPGFTGLGNCPWAGRPAFGVPAGRLLSLHPRGPALLLEPLRVPPPGRSPVSCNGQDGVRPARSPPP